MTWVEAILSLKQNGENVTVRNYLTEYYDGDIAYVDKLILITTAEHHREVIRTMLACKSA